MDIIYNKFSGKKKKPGEKNFMSLEEFLFFCKSANIYSENFVERDVQLAFNMSMMTSIDEIESEKIYKMIFVEFLEAVARFLFFFIFLL